MNIWLIWCEVVMVVIRSYLKCKLVWFFWVLILYERIFKRFFFSELRLNGFIRFGFRGWIKGEKYFWSYVEKYLI